RVESPPNATDVMAGLRLRRHGTTPEFVRLKVKINPDFVPWKYFLAVLLVDASRDAHAEARDRPREIELHVHFRVGAGAVWMPAEPTRVNIVLQHGDVSVWLRHESREHRERDVREPEVKGARVRLIERLAECTGRRNQIGDKARDFL